MGVGRPAVPMLISPCSKVIQFVTGDGDSAGPGGCRAPSLPAGKTQSEQYGDMDHWTSPLLPSCCGPDILSLFYAIKLPSVHTIIYLYIVCWAYAILLLKPGLVFLFCTPSQTRITCILRHKFPILTKFRDTTCFTPCKMLSSWDLERKRINLGLYHL